MIESCVVCGASIHGKWRFRLGEKFCSWHCYGSLRPKRDRRKARVCQTCGTDFMSAAGRYCSLACRPRDAMAYLRWAEEAVVSAQLKATKLEARLARLDAAEAVRHRTCEACYRPFRALRAGQRTCGRGCPALQGHGLVSFECVSCHGVFESIHPNARYCSNRCRKREGKKCVAEAHRRNAASKIRRLRPTILGRWGSICYLCGSAITIEADSAHPGALTIDHVVPLAVGGTDDILNLRPAHRGCNVDKGERQPSWFELMAAPSVGAPRV